MSSIGIEDFGHVFSNVSYLLSGFTFMLIVLVRSNRYKVGFFLMRSRDTKECKKW